jgi:hypothetical protein
MDRNGNIRLYADPGAIPGTNWVQVTPAERKRLSGLIEYYRKKPKPFTACVNDNTKRFGRERAQRICAVLKDLIMGGTGWRKGSRKLADGTELVPVPEPYMTIDELLAVIEAAEEIAGRRY